MRVLEVLKYNQTTPRYTAYCQCYTFSVTPIVSVALAVLHLLSVLHLQCNTYCQCYTFSVTPIVSVTLAVLHLLSVLHLQCYTYCQC